MEKIVILSFLFLACVVLESSSQATTPVPEPSMTTNATTSMPVMSTPAPEDNGTSTTEATQSTTTPTSGVVSVKALAGFVASFALIALF